MNKEQQIRARLAIKIANTMRAERSFSHVSIFANILVNNEKIGHIVSDGYTHDHWSFYPVEERRIAVRQKSFEDVLPKWVANSEWHLGEFENSIEKLEKTEAEKKVAYRKGLLKDPVYTAFDSEGFPCNPIPFATALAAHVREFGTDSIKSDDAKKILWILMGQAYGQLAKIDMCDEWDRLQKLVLPAT